MSGKEKGEESLGRRKRTVIPIIGRKLDVVVVFGTMPCLDFTAK